MLENEVLYAIHELQKQLQIANKKWKDSELEVIKLKTYNSSFENYYPIQSNPAIRSDNPIWIPASSYDKGVQTDNDVVVSLLDVNGTYHVSSFAASYLKEKKLRNQQMETITGLNLKLQNNLVLINYLKTRRDNALEQMQTELDERDSVNRKEVKRLQRVIRDKNRGLRNKENKLETVCQANESKFLEIKKLKQIESKKTTRKAYVV